MEGQDRPNQAEHLGLKTPLTGKYSRDLEKQVRIFQKTHKLPVTGKVDDKTYFRIQ